MLGRTLDERQREGIRIAKEHGTTWVPDDLWRADFEKVASTIARMERAISGAQEANQKQLGGMTIEQLEAQFKAELLRAAAGFTKADWAALDKIRMKQALDER